MTDIAFIALIYLIQHPDEYHMKNVRLIGPASIEFEHKALYFSSDDQKHAVTKNAIWLDIDLSDVTKEFDGKYILVEGVFDKDNLGHLKMFSGSLKKINRIEVWSKDEE